MYAGNRNKEMPLLVLKNCDGTQIEELVNPEVFGKDHVRVSETNNVCQNNSKKPN